MNKNDQKELIENVEVSMYEKTKEKAEIDIQTEALIDFLAIFGKKLKENQADQSTKTWGGLAAYALGMTQAPQTIGTQDMTIFKQLNKKDQKEVNAILKPLGINYDN